MAIKRVIFFIINIILGLYVRLRWGSPRSALWQDLKRTIPVKKDGDKIAIIESVEGDIHFVQNDLDKRPTLRKIKPESWYRP